MRILVIGSDGQVGRELVAVLAPLGTVLCGNRQVLELSHLEQIAPTLAALKPDVVVNAAAYTAVDQAETEPDLADLINHQAAQAIAQACQQLSASLLHISTDYVFDGQQSHPYRETDSPHPLCVYGRSKLAGETAIQSLCQSYLILRTAWVYGSYGRQNFVKTMLRLGAERAEIAVVADQVGTPTWAKDLAGAIAQLIPHLHPSNSGIYHYTNSGVASWYDFAVAIFEEAKLLGFPLTVQRVRPITTADYPTLAHRPAYSVLSGHQLVSLTQTVPPHWRQSLRAMLSEFKSFP